MGESMTFSVGKLAKQKAQALIQPAIKNINDIEEINAQIIKDTRSTIGGELADVLRRGKITKAEYNEQMAQSKIELKDRLKSKKQLEEQLARFNQFENEKDEVSSFVISADTNRGELKELISVLKIDIATTAEPNEKLFLETILQTAESYKTMIDEGKPIVEKEIPILKSEQGYADRLLASLARTKKVKPDVLNDYINQMEAVKSFRDKTTNDPTLPSAEKKFINKLCDKLDEEIIKTLKALTTAATAGTSPAKIIENHQKKIEEHLETANTMAAKLTVTSGFKGLINSICKIFDCKPIFTTNKAVGAVQSIKSQLNALKEQGNTAGKEEESKIRLK